MGDTVTRAATDVGGTFTDLFCLQMNTVTGACKVITAKSDNTPPEFERGVLHVIDKPGTAPAEIDFLAHGTTVVINA